MRWVEREPVLAAQPVHLLAAAVGTWVLVLAGLALTLSPWATGAVTELDETVRAYMVVWERAWLVRVGEVLAVTGGVWITAPLRVLVGVWLFARRWWWRFGAWLGSIALSEVVVTALKDGFGRQRPPAALEATRSDAFPSGHTAATAVTVVTLLLLCLPPGATRRRWSWAAAVVVTAMGVSRVYLRVHWLSDVIMGAGIGVAAALSAVGVAAAGQRWRRTGPRGTTPS
ncbi:MAG: phosphatase PAP2 family protein [Nitriliruptor sp.]|nr:MAG: phosphatase PAP2 family protein [Nitriliruptor sp.]TVR24105.1 MAG: phosphatase PAP2 family protein [Nitriliruptor sp.]